MAEAAQVIPLKQNGSDLAIVLVHGLNSSAKTAFTNPATSLSWSDLISSDARELLHSRSLSEADIYAVDYSEVFADPSIDVSIEEIAQQVSDAIVSSGIVRDYNHVWFIAHSLGGLLIKRSIVRWSSDGYDRYLEHILGITLLGVPSNGAPLADLGDTAYGQLIAQWLGIKARNVRDLRTISTTNTYLAGLENDWAQFLSRRDDQLRGFPRVSCGYETAAEYHLTVPFLWFFHRSINVRIVPAIYAKTRCDGEMKAINKSHTELPKPSNRNDPIEDWLFRSVRAAMLRLERRGEAITDGDATGAFWRTIRLVNSGHKRLDRAGVPMIDQSVKVNSADAAIVEGLRLKSRRYVGATWADVFDRVQEDNACIGVQADSTRRRIAVHVDNPVACPMVGPGSERSWACNASDC